MVASSAICDLLYQLGISANYKGFLHTAYAVSLCVEQQDRLLLVTKWLYPDVARKYGTNWKAVERNIRTSCTKNIAQENFCVCHKRTTFHKIVP